MSLGRNFQEVQHRARSWVSHSPDRATLPSVPPLKSEPTLQFPLNSLPCGISSTAVRLNPKLYTQVNNQPLASRMLTPGVSDGQCAFSRSSSVKLRRWIIVAEDTQPPNKISLTGPPAPGPLSPTPTPAVNPFLFDERRTNKPLVPEANTHTVPEGRGRLFIT